MSEKHVPAFKEKLVVSPFDKPDRETPRLYEFENDKRFVVRKMEKRLFEGGQFTTPEEMGAVLTRLFDELRNAYNIDAPVQFIVTEDENHVPSLYNLTERIAAVDFEDFDNERRQEAITGIRAIFTSLVDYYERKLASGETFLTDIPSLEQFVYGMKDGDQAPKWYLVDTDPFFSNGNEGLFKAADMLRGGLSYIEEKFEIQLDEQKGRADVLIDKVSNRD